jgi:hypothetical protein
MLLPRASYDHPIAKRRKDDFITGSGQRCNSRCHGGGYYTIPTVSVGVVGRRRPNFSPPVVWPDLLPVYASNSGRRTELGRPAVPRDLNDKVGRIFKIVTQACRQPSALTDPGRFSWLLYDAWRACKGAATTDALTVKVVLAYAAALFAIPVGLVALFRSRKATDLTAVGSRGDLSTKFFDALLIISLACAEITTEPAVVCLSPHAFGLFPGARSPNSPSSP